MTQMTPQQTFELALQHHQAGRLAQAEPLYRQVLAEQPKHPGALHLLGVIALQTGRHDEAVDLIDQALELQPNWPEACSNLGEALKAQGDMEQAIAAYRHAIVLKPDYAQAHNNLGSALQAVGQLDQAIAAYHQALALKPNYPGAYSNLGNALRDKGQLNEAIAAFRQALALKPDFAEAHNNLGTALRDIGQMDEAIAAYRQAIALKPNFAEAYNNLGTALKTTGNMDAAITAIRQAIVLKPNFAEACNNLGNTLKNMARLDEAIAAYRQAMALKPNYCEAHSNLLFTLHYHPNFDAVAVAQEHRNWDRHYAEPLKQNIQPHLNDRNPDRRLRIGYVSPDLREHVNGWNILPVLEHHNHQQFEIFAYAQVPVPDATTQRIRNATDGWRSLVGLSDAQAADLIRQDGIDILVDLAGHTAHNRLLVLAHKPAPVQVTYLGYPNTTGMSTMDYRLTDAFADPPGQTEQFHSEQLFRLYPCAWCFQPTQAPPLTPRLEGPITFGCFNTFAKVTEPMLKLWARILQAVPESRVLLKAVGLGSPSTRQWVQDIFQQSAISRDRLELRGHEPGYGGHLALYSKMDISLDTFPYHGTNTTWEALWMGVPVITLAGQSHVSRVGVSLLNNMGLPELVANSREEYVQIAVNLANDLPRLQDLRGTLRPRMQASPLMNAPKFARNIEWAYRQMWKKCCSACAGGDVL